MSVSSVQHVNSGGSTYYDLGDGFTGSSEIGANRLSTCLLQVCCLWFSTILNNSSREINNYPELLQLAAAIIILLSPNKVHPSVVINCPFLNSILRNARVSITWCTSLLISSPVLGISCNSYSILSPTWH